MLAVDYRWRSGSRDGQQTRCARKRRMPAPARARLTGKSREELQPRAPTLTWRTTTRRAEDAGCGRSFHRPFSMNSSFMEEFMTRRDIDPRRYHTPGSAVGKDSDEALHCIF